MHPFPALVAVNVLQPENVSLLRRENAEKRQNLLDKINKTDIIIAVKQPNAMTKPVSRNGSKREGDGASPLFTPQNSHFGAVCDEQNGSSPLSDH
jgi:hypothetical protein